MCIAILICLLCIAIVSAVLVIEPQTFIDEPENYFYDSPPLDYQQIVDNVLLTDRAAKAIPDELPKQHIPTPVLPEVEKELDIFKHIISNTTPVKRDKQEVVSWNEIDYPIRTTNDSDITYMFPQSAKVPIIHGQYMLRVIFS
jgi:hypothetical protein